MSNSLNLPEIHHYAYVVDELDAAARRMHAQFGATMGRVGIEPTTLGLRVPCSTS
jgi:hypothetical protein